ncbi:MAG: hypothetical protein ACRDT6_22635 [Micromonosporaceae bacterium]
MDTQTRTPALGHRPPLLAAAALLLAVPVATWWLVGDLSEVPESADPDYLVRPWQLGALEPVLGALGLTVVLLTGAWLVRRAHRFDQRWWLVWCALLLAGLVVGFGWRVVTAASIGANIGAGLVLLFGTPFLGVLLLWSVAWSVYLVLRGRRSAP